MSDAKSISKSRTVRVVRSGAASAAPVVAAGAAEAASGAASVSDSKFSVPTSGTIYYQGTWASGGYPWLVAHGSVASEVDYAAKTAKIVLRYEGVFLKGTVKQMETNVSPTTATNSAGVVTTTYVFELKGAGTKKQNLQFAATSISAGAIGGTYTSYSPADKGTFEMKAVTMDQFHEFMKQSGACTIM